MCGEKYLILVILMVLTLNSLGIHIVSLVAKTKESFGSRTCELLRVYADRGFFPIPLSPKDFLYAKKHLKK